MLWIYKCWIDIDVYEIYLLGIPTATKTNYIETSPYLNTPSLKSPTRIHSKMQEDRESIGSMIN